MDLLERAFYESKAMDFHELADWLSQHGGYDSQSEEWIRASYRAAEASRIFPDSPEELRSILARSAPQSYGNGLNLNLGYS